MVNIGDKLSNPRKHAIRKWLSEILKERYPKHEAIADRLSHAIVTDGDLNEFSRLIADVFEVGYLKCMNDYKQKLADMGLSVNVVAERPR